MSRRGGFESKFSGFQMSSNCTGAPPRGSTVACHGSFCSDPFPVPEQPTPWAAAASHFLVLAEDQSAFMYSLVEPSGLSEFGVSEGR